MKTIRDHGGNVLYPANAPTPDTLKYNDINLKDIACKFFDPFLDSC